MSAGTFNQGANAMPAPRAGTASIFLDETRPGSAWQQIGVGIVGIMLAITLVVGQITVATTRGIHSNLKVVVEQMGDGNKTMEEIIEKGKPSMQLEKTIGKKAVLLTKTRDSMVVMNDAMDSMGKTTDGLYKTVLDMRNTSRKLKVGVASMNSDTGKMVVLLGELPDGTDRTHVHLKRMATDSSAIVGELNALSGKMEGFGLEKARNVGGRG